MSRRQRIVLVTALGVIAIVAAIVINAALDRPDDAWFTYAPNNSVLASEMPLNDPAISPGVVWITAIGLWIAVSALVLRGRPARADYRDGMSGDRG